MRVYVRDFSSPPVANVRNGLSLTVSVVTFNSDLDKFASTMMSLQSAVDYAYQRGGLQSVRLAIVDNDSESRSYDLICKRIDELWSREFEVLSLSSNLGFGQGHNHAIAQGCGDFHLILNPDIVLSEDALAAALDFLRKHPKTGVLSPYVEDSTGKKEYLCKCYPSVFDLVVRGFFPGPLQEPFKKRLAHYELRGVTESQPVSNVPLASGCFMFFRRAALEESGGFSPDYFLYFEDFDLSLRIGKHWDISYVPSVKVVHHGGYAAKKGLRHILMFARSGRTFFSHHGWKWW